MFFIIVSIKSIDKALHNLRTPNSQAKQANANIVTANMECLLQKRK